MKFFLSAFLTVAVAVLGLSSPGLTTTITYTANLDGPSEFPPNASPGTGFAQVTFDDTANTLRVQMSFSGLVAPTTAAHIHAATAVPLTGIAGVATQTPFFVGFPIGVTSGTYDHTFDMTLTSSFNTAFVTANGGTAASAEAELGRALAAGEAYLNIHSSMFTAGEIRGFLVPVTGTRHYAALRHWLSRLGRNPTQKKQTVVKPRQGHGDPVLVNIPHQNFDRLATLA